MSAERKKSLLVVVRHTPYGSSLARTALEVALSSSSFEQNIGLLFMGDGVLQLLPDQDSQVLQLRNISKLIASFPLYDLNRIFVDEKAIDRCGINKNELPGNSRLLNGDAMHELMCSYDHILGF